MIYTYSKFYYGFTVTENNKYLDFNEGGAEINATLTLGNYTLSTIIPHIQSVLNSNGTNTYTVSVDRSTRYITITSSGTLNLLVTTGTYASTSYYSEIGFSADQTGNTSYTGSASGNVYSPQFKFQSFVSPDDNIELVKATVNESTSGALEIVTFGEKSFYEFNMRYINNFTQPSGGPIKSDNNAVESARAFLTFAIRKRPVEIMIDEDDSDTFDRILLESTSENGQGTSFKLKETFGRLPDYYETGITKWRKL